MASPTTTSDTPRTHVDVLVAALRRRATKQTLEGLRRYGIPSDRALGVAMRDIQAIATENGKDHGLALDLWTTGWYEARLLAAYVDEPAKVTRAQMDRWCRDFDNWAVCDTVCFALFDRTGDAWAMVKKWADRRAEFVKRAAFALVWGLSVHDKQAPDALFLDALGLIERAATDDRHYVQRAVDMALRAVGKRNAVLRAAATTLAQELVESPAPSAAWIGRNALRELRRSASRARRTPQRR